MEKFTTTITPTSHVVVELLPINSVKVSFYSSDVCVFDRVLFPFAPADVIPSIDLGDKKVNNGDVVMGPNYVYLYLVFDDYSTFNGTIAAL